MVKNSFSSAVFLSMIILFSDFIKGETPPTKAPHYAASPTINANFTGPFVPEVARFLQIETCSHDLEIDLFALSEDFKTRVNRAGFDPELMLKSAFANAQHPGTTDNTLFPDLTFLLKRFVRHRMSIISIYMDRFFDHSEIKKLFTRYKLVEPPRGALLAADDFTLYRLAMAFPYETAAIRARYVDDTKLPGVVGTLNRIFAFPYAPLIIPPSWKGVHALWKKWFHSFATSMVGYPLPDELKRRQEKQYQSMLILAKEREASLLDLMELLGVSEETAIKPLCDH